MPCLCCLGGVLIGGYIGSRFGIAPPPDTKGQILSASITFSLASITALALESISTFSLSLQKIIPLGYFAVMALETVVLMTVYSIGVNYLLNRYVFSSSEEETSEEESTPCCCHKDSPS